MPNRINKKPKIIADFNDVSYSGYGVGTTSSGETVYAWNAFPGEFAEVELFSQQQPFKGTAVRTKIRSSHRIEPREKHFLISAPWQVIDYDYELELKQKMFSKIWQEQAGRKLDIDFFIADPDKAWHYRNSMEFNVVKISNGWQLALMKRGRQEYVPIEKSELVYPVINQIAHETIEVLNQKNFKTKDIKQIIVRANRQGETMAGVYNFNDDLIYSLGREYLEEKIGSLKFRFGLKDFWQPNIEVFAQALAEIIQHSQSEMIVDMYAGVGVIGLSLAEPTVKVWLVEQSPTATQMIRENIKLNNIKSAQAINSPTEQALGHIARDKIIIFDPPRTGLDNETIRRILEVKPSKIIYLSCKPYTQCLDIKNLLDDYKISHTSLYNFFPRTPHLESLIVLEKL